MNEPNVWGRLLLSLLRRGQDNETVDLFALAGDCATSSFELLRALEALQSRGLVDARRLRLSLDGLAVAQALRSQSARPVAETERRKSSRPPVRTPMARRARAVRAA
jgi:hypothetical protein